SLLRYCADFWYICGQYGLSHVEACRGRLFASLSWVYENWRIVMRISTGYGERPAGGGFETFSWYFFRISAIGLIFLVIIHLLLNHVVHDVACTSYQLVALRYAN